jgi:hypothetical protein
MSKYLLSDILQYVLNEYIEHTNIEKYNRAFSFKFTINKYSFMLTETYTCGSIKAKKYFTDDIPIWIENYDENGDLYSVDSMSCLRSLY